MMVMAQWAASRRDLLRAGGIVALGLLTACSPPPTPVAQPTPAQAPTPAPPPAAAAPTAAVPTAFAKATAAPAAATPATKTYPPATVTIADPGANSHKATVLLMKNQGYFKQFGITETVQNLASNMLIPALVTGTVDMGIFFGTSAVLTAVDAGAGLKVISGARIRSNFLIASARPEIKSVTDLEGKTVGTSGPGTLGYNIAMALLKKYRMDSSKVEFVNAGGNTVEVFKAVAAKKVDVGLTETSFIPSMEKAGLTYFAEVWKELPDFVASIAFTSDQAIARKRDALVRTVAAYGHFYRFMRSLEAKDAYMKAFQEIGGSADDAEFDWRWNRDAQAFAYDLTLTEQQLGYMQQLGVDLGLQKAVLPFNKIADMSLAQDALKIMTIS